MRIFSRKKPREKSTSGSLAHRLRRAAATHSSGRGAFSAGMCAVVTAAVIIFNLIFAQLPAEKMQLDMTGSQIYNITSTSREYLAAMDQDVEIHVLAAKSSVDSRIVRFLEKYVSLSEHLSLEYVDPDVYPSVLSTYGVSAGTVVVTCADTGRQETFDLDDVFGYDMMSYYYYGQTDPTSFDCEGLLTSAVDGVLRAQTRKAYVLSGHGETSLPTEMESLLKKNHLDTVTVNLLTDGGVPEDSDVLILNAPTRDLADDELNMLETYLAGGGQLVCTLASQLDALPNLEQLLADYGMILTDGMIADTQRYYNNNPYLIFPEVDSSVDVASSLSSDSTILLYAARGMTLSDPARDGITVSAFLTTSSGGVNVAGNQTQTAGTYVLAAAATEETDGGTARLTVIGCDSLCSGDILGSFSNLDNASLFLSAVSCGFTDQTTLDISPVTISNPVNTITTGGLWALVFVFVIPGGLLLTGLFRWMRRRKL